MSVRPLRFVVFGLSITSSWGNGHASTYRALLAALAARGHALTFFERDLPLFAANRDLPRPACCETYLYGSFEQLADEHAALVRSADVVVVGSFVPDGARVIDWALATAKGITAFYDIDTPVTLARLENGDGEHLSARQVPAFDVYLSFTGGPVLRELERRWGARRARPLYCSADPMQHVADVGAQPRWDLGYLGTYSADRQAALDALLVEPARTLSDGRFVVAGPQYPDGLGWPANVSRVQHLSPAEHRAFYTSQRFTLNVTRRDMVLAGWSPSVRLFEAAACGTPVVSDVWTGIETFFRPGLEIFLANDAADVVRLLKEMPEDVRRRAGERARDRVACEHTANHRAHTLEEYVGEAAARRVAREGVF